MLSGLGNTDTSTNGFFSLVSTLNSKSLIDIDRPVNYGDSGIGTIKSPTVTK